MFISATVLNFGDSNETRDEISESISDLCEQTVGLQQQMDTAERLRANEGN